LEEQLHATEQRWAEKLNEEKAKAREMTQRTDRERQLEAEKEALRLVILNGLFVVMVDPFGKNSGLTVLR